MTIPWSQYRREVEGQIREAFCQVFERPFIGEEGSWLDLGGGGLSTGQAAFRQMYNWICPVPRKPPLGFPVPGGQCEGIEYTISIQVTTDLAGTGPLAPLNILFVGPLRGFSVVYLDARRTYEIFALAANGNFFAAGAGPFPSEVTVTNIFSVVTRVDGQADNCGPGAAPEPPPGYNQTDIDITFTEGDTTYNFPGDITFGPFVFGGDNKPHVPFVIRLAPDIDIAFNGDIDLSGPTGPIINIDINPAGPRDPIGGLPGGCGTPNPNPTDDPPPVPDPLPPPPPPPGPGTAEAVIVGAVITTGRPSLNATGLSQANGNPDIYLPRLGSIAFLIRSGRVSGWTSDIDVKNLRQFIPCPWPAGAVEVRGTPVPGTLWTITPVRSGSADTREILPFVPSQPEQPS